MVGIVLLGVFVLLLALGAPIAVCLGMSSVSAILVQGAGKPLEAIMSVLPRLCSSASSKFVLLAIPFFILSGKSRKSTQATASWRSPDPSDTG